MRSRLWPLAVLTLVLLSFAACTLGSTSSKSVEADQVEICTAVVWQIYTRDHSFQKPPEFSFVYILHSTDDRGGYPHAPQSDPVALPETVQAAITEALIDLPDELIWVDTEGTVETDPDTGLVANGDGIIITLGNAHFQEDDSVLVPAKLYWGNVCGIG